MLDLLNVLLTASLSFITLFIIAKIMGKKQISQLDFVDYAVGISIGSIAAQMSIDSTIPFYHFIVAMGIYMLFDIIISYSSIKSFKLKKIFRGKPLIILENGQFNYENLKKSRLDLNEFLALCRSKDYFDINDIAYCIFETNGQLSILPKSHATPLVTGDMNISKEKPALSIDFIVDGKIIDTALKQAKKPMSWLLDKLKEKGVEKLESIALVNYDEQNDEITVYNKN